MPPILPAVRFAVKEKLRRSLRRCRSAAVRIRYLIVLNLLQGRAAYATAEALGVHNTTVYRVARRFRDQVEGVCSTARRTTSPSGESRS